MKRRFLEWLSNRLFNWAERLDSYLFPNDYGYEEAEPDDYTAYAEDDR